MEYDDGLRKRWGMLEVMVLGVWTVILAGVLLCVLWDTILTILKWVV